MLNCNGWRRNGLLFILGVCATLTLAPFYIFPLIIPAYGGLFLLLQHSGSKKRAFADGWWWGWGFFITGLYWFCIALLTEPEKFAWAIPFCLFGLNAIIALYPAVGCLIFYILTRPRNKCGVTEVLLFSLIWLVIEYARGHLFTGFPWNLAGYSFGFSDISLQLASVLGAYGLTFFSVLLSTSATLIKHHKVFVGMVWGVFAVSLIWGNHRLRNIEIAEDTGAMLRLVQANIQQHHKWDPELQQKNLEEYIKITQSEGLENITHVIWSETAVPYPLRSNTALTANLGGIVPPEAVLITGTMRVQGRGDDFDFYNSVVAINHMGEIVGSYDKHALVPFGEFLPFRYLIPKNLKLPVGDKDFSVGEGVQTLSWQGLPDVSPLICYEVIFPEYATSDAHRPEWLLNLTNDAWFGMSTGPQQHFQMARMRAVEQGLPLVRVANTGITAYIDEYGQIKQKLVIGEKGFVDVSLQKPRLIGTTYTRVGGFFSLLTLCISIFIAYYMHCNRKI